MAFVVCGLNHKTAPLTVREKIALPAAMHEELLHDLLNQSIADEAIILSTCNRTELYCETKHPDALLPWLAHTQDISLELISPYFYNWHHHQAVHHTLRVASGLDSMMLGEPQILGQMKQAWQQGCRVGSVKQNLRSVFEYIFSASKRIRNKSGIGNNPISIAYAAVQLIGQLFNDYKPLKVLLIGSGETATLVAKYLHKQGVRDFSIASRTKDNARTLADVFNGKALTISDIPNYLCEADVVISATACPLPFINKNLVEHALTRRNHQQMFFLDLAIPRDIEANVAELQQVHLYNIDDLQGMIDKGMDERRLAALKAEQLIESELNDYIRWHRSQNANHVICHYRNQMEALAQLELQRARAKLSAGSCQERVLQELCNRLVNKLTHTPTAGLKQAARDGREELLDLTHYLFNTSGESIPL